MRLAPFSRAGPDDPGRELQRIIREGAAAAPRSRQTTIGLSELGHDCPRFVGMKSFGLDPVSGGGDPLVSIIGTAVHDWLANVFRTLDPDGTRWLVEQRVAVTDGLKGTADVLDRANGRVIDWKVLGQSRIREFRSLGPKSQYVAQVQLYGYGFARAGYEVREVALAMLPRGGRLSDLWLWRTAYDEAAALAVLDRWADTTQLAYLLDVEHHPQRWSHIPASPGPACIWCPFWAPGSTEPGPRCPGETLPTESPETLQPVKENATHAA